MRLADRLAPPPGAMLVRVRASGPGWVDRVPGSPSGVELTVSVSDPALRAVPAEALRTGGWRVVGVHPWRAPSEDSATIDLLVPAEVIADHPDWWHRLLAVADRAFDLRLGPVQRVLGQEIALHLHH